jgi:serine/threonine protein kinase
MALTIGTQLGSHQIIALLGKGGMGEVYQARDSKLGRSVAIKLLPDAFTHDAERTERFQREARVLASLNHPNIAAIHGIEESSGRKFLVMEFVPGETLAKRIKRGSMPIDEAVTIATQFLDGLEPKPPRSALEQSRVKDSCTGQKCSKRGSGEGESSDCGSNLGDRKIPTLPLRGRSL